MNVNLEDVASEIAYEILEHDFDVVTDVEQLQCIILKKLKEVDF